MVAIFRSPPLSKSVPQYNSMLYSPILYPRACARYPERNMPNLLSCIHDSLALFNPVSVIEGFRKRRKMHRQSHSHKNMKNLM